MAKSVRRTGCDNKSESDDGIVAHWVVLATGTLAWWEQFSYLAGKTVWMFLGVTGALTCLAAHSWWATDSVVAAVWAAICGLCFAVVGLLQVAQRFAVYQKAPPPIRRGGSDPSGDALEDQIREAESWR